MKRSALPLLVFVVLVGFMAAGLGLQPRDVPSPLVGRPAPSFSLPVLDTPGRTFTPQQLRGQVWLLNVWASWCVACQLEHPQLMVAARSRAVPIYGLNYKDRPADAIAWLRRHGDPYAASLSDLDGVVGIDLGVYGVPETFVIDREGRIRHKINGPMTPEIWRDSVLPLLGTLDG